ncbi:hypothetical protein V6N13_096769 [Hibiscus sabdariffa]
MRAPLPNRHVASRPRGRVKVVEDDDLAALASSATSDTAVGANPSHAPTPVVPTSAATKASLVPLSQVPPASTKIDLVPLDATCIHQVPYDPMVHTDVSEC